MNGEHKKVSVKVFTLSRQLGLTKEFGVLTNQEVTINTKNLKSSVCLVNTGLDEDITTQRLIIR